MIIGECHNIHRLTFRGSLFDSTLSSDVERQSIDAAKSEDKHTKDSAAGGKELKAKLDMLQTMTVKQRLTIENISRDRECVCDVCGVLNDRLSGS